jgi:ketosteroid isomerase-like protein
MKLRLLALVTCLLVTAGARPSPEIEVRKTLAEFIQAFDNLNWDKFRSFFSADATVFFPRQFPSRAQGRAEIEAGFRQVFEQIRAGKSLPPYMDIQPRSLLVQVSGDVAIATFHLDDRAGFLNRRTIVLSRKSGSWKIIHLHASEVQLP